MKANEFISMLALLSLLSVTALQTGCKTKATTIKSNVPNISKIQAIEIARKKYGDRVDWSNFEIRAGFSKLGYWWVRVEELPVIPDHYSTIMVSAKDGQIVRYSTNQTACSHTNRLFGKVSPVKSQAQAEAIGMHEAEKMGWSMETTDISSWSDSGHWFIVMSRLNGNFIQVAGVEIPPDWKTAIWISKCPD